MKSKLLEFENGYLGENHLLPFLWLHGEDQERVKEEILAIKNTGARAFCAESRVYEKFCEDQWWEDFGFILKTAKELDMKVWLLDDRKFPTGYANGYLEKEENAHLRKKCMREQTSTVVGPQKCAKSVVDQFLNKGRGEELLSVIAYRFDGEGDTLCPDSAIDLTDSYKDGCVYWDVPSGVWRVCILIKTTSRVPDGLHFKYLVDILNKESCMSQIKAVYEPQYEHFAEYFGNTFLGFFSDEPGFYNSEGSYQVKLGFRKEHLPWSEEIAGLVAKSAGISEETAKKLLPALWEDLGSATTLIRTHYMEVLSKIYEENFCNLLGNWCREHNVMYIGHVIEDNNANMRLGYGPAHYFRALNGQDMAGMDIVLNQDIPGVSSNTHYEWLGDMGYVDTKFFHYTLPKLASSHSHIQPLKKGRAMCEIFGAFGWAEGLPFMKQLADTMLVCGINEFVPHAFSCKTNDPDCPPHFYNGGNNIQYPLFAKLSGYMNRVADILQGGTHRASVAVFYNAEGEWAGTDVQLYEEICTHLTKANIDFDILPFDVLVDAKVQDGKLYINEENYGALLVSACDTLPFDRLSCFASLAKSGLPVIFTDKKPVKSAENKPVEDLLKNFDVISLENLSKTLKEKGLYEISGENCSALRFYHVSKDGEELYMFYNDDLHNKIDTDISIAQNGSCIVYDPWANKCYKTEAKQNKLHLALDGGNAIIVSFGSEVPENLPDFVYQQSEIDFPLTFDIYTKNEDESEFTLIAKNSTLFDISSPDKAPSFSGTVIYKTRFTAIEGYNVLDLGQVGETAEVYLNGVLAGIRVNAPYKFDISNAKTNEENELEIRVISSLSHKRRDMFSWKLSLPATGILGDIKLCKYEK